MSESRRDEIQLVYSGGLGAWGRDTFVRVSHDGERSWLKPYSLTGATRTVVLGGQQGWNGYRHGKSTDGMIGIAEIKGTNGREDPFCVDQIGAYKHLSWMGGSAHGAGDDEGGRKLCCRVFAELRRWDNMGS